jgi:hypothetical protein
MRYLDRIDRFEVLDCILVFTISLSVIMLMLAALSAALLLFGCATADPPMVKGGCQVDLKKVCQYSVDWYLEHGGLVAFSDGMQLDRQRLQNLSVRHLEVNIPFTHGSGALLRCVVDTQTARVTDGHVSDGPQLNDADIEHIRQQGLCQ